MRTLWLILVLLLPVIKAHKRYDHIYLDTYESQLPNNVILLEFATSDNGSAKFPSTGMEMEDEICSWMIEQLDSVYHDSPFFESECRIASNRTREYGIDLDVLLVTPLPFLDISRVYGNPDDLVYTIGYAIENGGETVKQPWHVRLIDIHILQLGQAHSSVSVLGIPVKPSKFKASNRTWVSIYSRQACQQTLTQLLAKHSDIRIGLRGCWTSKHTTANEVEIIQRIYFDWYLLRSANLYRNKNQFNELFRDSLMIKKTEYKNEVFNVSKCEVKKVHDQIDVLFKGSLVDDTIPRRWKQELRMLGGKHMVSLDYKITEQVRGQIIVGNLTLSNAISDVYITSIRPNSSGSLLEGSLLEGRIGMSQTDMAKMKLDLDQLPKLLEKAYDNGTEIDVDLPTIEKKSITDMDIYTYQDYFPKPRFGYLSTFDYSNIPEPQPLA